MFIDTIAQRLQRFGRDLNHKPDNHRTPSVELTINGKPFGTHTLSRIISIELTDKRGFEADELTITLDDHDGSTAIPPLDGTITLAIGYTNADLVSKGSYRIVEYTHSGSPDQISITAHSADTAATLQEQQEKSWHKQTLAKIVETIAARHGYKARISSQYQNQQIPHIDQTNESDASFLSRLAEDYDAIATVKDGHLLFIVAGSAQTAGGAAIPPLHITRAQGDNHSFTYSTADSYQAVRAYYTDKKTGKKKEVLVNKENAYPERPPTAQNPDRKSKPKKRPPEKPKTINTEGQKIKTLRHLYATEAAALSGARSAWRKLARGKAKFSYSLAQGNPNLYPETPVIVSGIKPEIDAEQWLSTEIKHSISSSGYTCQIEMEALINLDE